jgi:hypothetical protein
LISFKQTPYKKQILFSNGFFSKEFSAFLFIFKLTSIDSYVYLIECIVLDLDAMDFIPMLYKNRSELFFSYTTLSNFTNWENVHPRIKIQ